MIRNLISFLAISICVLGYTQKVDFGMFKNIKIRSIGPAGMSGRITSIDALESNPNFILVGTASGGVWNSINGGLTWKPIFDDAPIQGIGSVAIQQSNPDVLWAGTGEGNPRNSHTCGEGIFKSIDGGRTWQRKGLENTKTIHRIIIDKRNPDVVYAGCIGSPWGANQERGVYKTKDGGETWERILYVNDLTGCADLIVDPNNPNKLFAAMWEHKREPWFFNSGGEGSGLYMTLDGGENWKRLDNKNGLPKGELGRIGLGMSAANSKVVYALVESKEYALYKSVDGGFNWTKTATKNVGNRPFYYADLFVDPSNENTIYSLHTLITRSDDGGKTFDVIIPYTGAGVHPDHHAMWINPKNSNHIIEGNDGGLNITFDRAKTWKFVENIPVAQFYHINIDNDYPYNVYGGMQDNGSYVGPSQVHKRGGISNFDWQEVLFGDGFDVMPDAEDNRYGYAMYQKGNLYRYDLKTGQTEYIQPNHPEGTKLRFNWNAGLAQDPFNKKGIYFGSQFVHYSDNKGKDWKIISPDLSTNDSTKQKQAESGGLSIDATGAENHTSILCIAPSPLNNDVIWVGTDDGNLQLTMDRGKTWKNLSSKLEGPDKGFWIPQIEVSKINDGEAFVIVNDYRRNDFAPYVYHTQDFGKTFKRIAKNVSGYALSIVQHPKQANLLFLGTENGLFVSIDYGLTWTKWNNDYPSVSTMDLKIQERENDLVIGTYGRAIYILENLTPLVALAQTNGEVIEESFSVLNEEVKGHQFNKLPAKGVRFTADGYFKGENTSDVASVGVWIKEPYAPKSSDENKKSSKSKGKSLQQEDSDSDKNEKLKWDKIIVDITNVKGDTIYTYEVEADTGYQTVSWWLNERGIRYPNRKPAKKDAKDSWGPQVSPGVYYMNLRYAGIPKKVKINVYSDPRIEFDEEAHREGKLLYERFKKVVQEAEESMSKLVDAKSDIAKITSYFDVAPDSVIKKINKESDLILDSIAKLQDLFNQNPKLKGYQDNSDKLNTSLGHASSLIESCSGKPSSNVRIAIDNAENKTKSVVEKVESFTSGLWMEYLAKVKEFKSSLDEGIEELLTPEK